MLGVVVFHLDPGWLRGGFVGVDVFFVLSGYLITGLLWRQLERDDSFRYRDFFVRRVRRLTPNLLVVTLLTYLVGSWVLVPRLVDALAESVWAQPFAVQNFYFLLSGNYFTDATEKPLLHTWSLGVEEQFYFVWPFVLVWLHKRGHTRTLVGMFGVGMASFAACVVATDILPKLGFYLFPARAWELSVGGLLAVAQAAGRLLPRRPVVATLTTLAGLVALAGSMVISYDESEFPGIVASLPVFATAAVVYGTSGDASNPARQALGVLPLRWLGKLSYSLYLWHWPVIVYAVQLGHRPGNPATALLLAMVALALSALSYRFVEEPVRRGRVLPSTRPLVLAVAGASVALVTLAATSKATAGYAFRYSEPARSILTAPFRADGDERCGAWFRYIERSRAICRVGADEQEADDGGILLWGNSHAAMWVGLLEELADESGRPLYLNARNCRATRDHSTCGRALQASIIRESVVERGVDDVVLASTWHGEYGRPDAELESELTEVVRELVASGVDVWLVVDVPEDPLFDPGERYAVQRGAMSHVSSPLDRTRHDTEARFFSSLAESMDRVHVIDPVGAYCSDDVCFSGAGVETWYRDHEHLTHSGAMRARRFFEPIFVQSRRSGLHAPQ